MTTLRNLTPRLATISTRIVAPAPKTADPHYQSAEHRAWRTEVLRRAAHRCQDCGRTGTRLFADHVIELRDGGPPTDPANGRALCGACHTKKTAQSRAQRMSTHPHPPQG